MKDFSRTPENATRNINREPQASKQTSMADYLAAQRKEILQRKALEEEELLQGKFETVQCEEIEEEELLQGKFETAQREERPNNTGLPDNLKVGIENMSGYSMDDVKVHFNSDKPAQLNALAYAQGTDIHIAPGQEKHLPHEAWHVVQQKQGRVQSTTQLQGVNVNDNEGLEKEADTFGGISLQKKQTVEKLNNTNVVSKTIQRTEVITKPDLEHNIVKSSLFECAKSLRDEIIEFKAEIEDRRATDHRVLNHTEVNQLNALDKLKEAVKTLVDGFTPIFTKMPKEIYVNGYEKKGSINYAIVEFKNKLLGYIDNFNSLLDGTFDNIDDVITVNKLEVRAVINIAHLESKDTGKVILALRNGTLTDRHKTTIGINRPQHAHLHDGNMGIAFTYRKEDNGSITPYLYDYAKNRSDNKYNWVIAKEQKSGPPSIP